MKRYILVFMLTCKLNQSRNQRLDTASVLQSTHLRVQLFPEQQQPERSMKECENHIGSLSGSSPYPIITFMRGNIVA